MLTDAFSHLPGRIRELGRHIVTLCLPYKQTPDSHVNTFDAHSPKETLGQITVVSWVHQAA